MDNIIPGLNAFDKEWDSETKETLKSFLEARIALHTAKSQMEGLRILHLSGDPSVTAEALELHHSTHIIPAQKKHFEHLKQLLHLAINVGELKALLPMIVLGITQSVDVRLLFLALDLDEESIGEIITSLKDLVEGRDWQ